MPIAKDLEQIAKESSLWAARNKVGSKGPVLADMDLPVNAAYTLADVPDLDYLNDLGFPGEFPFTRGPYPEMSRYGPWRYSIYSGFGSAEDTNARWRLLYEAGQRSLNLAPDLPTHLGLDSDDPSAEEEVGRVGMAVDSVQDLEVLFAGLPIDEVPFSTNVEALAPIMMAFFIAAAQKRGIPLAKLSGTISNDPLSTAAAKQTVVFPLGACVRITVDLIEFCASHMPRFYPINVKGVNFREGGSNMVQEIGFTFANAIYYLEEGLKRGLNAEAIAAKISFFLCEGLHLFEEVAKYRAARRLWARMLKERFGASRPEALRLRFTAICNPRDFARELPELNLVRGALGILAAALGGAQGMLHPAYDEAYDIPSEKSHLLALASQQVIAEESNITKTVDPLGGSYYVEFLTNSIEKAIADKIKEVETYGGPVKAIQDGIIQKQILDNFCREEQDTLQGRKVVVGRNKYQVKLSEETGSSNLALHRSDPLARERQIERLQRVKATRDNSLAQKTLTDLRQAAQTNANLMPFLINAAASYATLGEITGTLKEVFGEYREPTVI